MSNLNNQFFDFLKPFYNAEFLANYMKNTPVMDFTSLTNMFKKNTEALSELNQTAARNVQTVVKKGAEIFQNNATHTFNAVKNAVSVQDFEQMAAHQQNYVKSMMENGLNDAKEMMNVTSEASMEIASAVSKNLTENVNGMFEKMRERSGNV